MRTYLTRLAECGELATVQAEVNWYLEAGALCALSNKTGGPALLFPVIADYPGYSLAGSLFAGPGMLYPHPLGRTPWRRLAIALGMDQEIGYEELMAELLRRRDHPLAPVQVASGSCKEERRLGKEVDLPAFPWPHLCARDGGRYMTAGVIIAQNRAGTWVNWSVCRGLINGRDKLVLNITPDSHLARLHREYEEKGEPMPASIVLGGDPACFIAAALNVPWGMSEAAVAGGLKGNPVALVRSETNSLLVPAEAEVILEGRFCRAKGCRRVLFWSACGMRPASYGLYFLCGQSPAGKIPSFPLSPRGLRSAFCTKYGLINNRLRGRRWARNCEITALQPKFYQNWD